MCLNNFDNIKEIVITTLENNGVIVELTNGDADISSYPIDSITFISFIVDLENALDIIFPDDYLSINTLQSINGFTNLLIELKTGS